MDKDPARENPRLKEYDYGTPGYYFVTQCTNIRNEDVLSHVIEKPSVGADDLIGPNAPDEFMRLLDAATLQLTPAGMIVRYFIEGIEKAYLNVTVDSYVIMPDHIHMILQIRDPGDGPMRSSAPTANLVQIMRALKSLSVKRIGAPIWQRSFYDRIIRTHEELNAYRAYLEQNPARWIVKHPKGDTHA